MLKFISRNLKESGIISKYFLSIILKLLILVIIFFGIVYLFSYYNPYRAKYFSGQKIEGVKIVIPTVDKVAYDLKMIELANYPIKSAQGGSALSGKVATSTLSSATTTTKFASTTPNLWPVKTDYPNVGALLPFNRIIAYYGNFYSKQMGVLGEYDEVTMLGKLNAEVQNWQIADPNTPVIPAIDYIAVTAQGSAGDDGMYRLRMGAGQIDYALQLANKINGVLFLDIQVGKSTLQDELPQLEAYLKLPQVHLAIDPEFSMKDGKRPGTIYIGTMDATYVNYAVNFLAKIVKENNLPPKMLVIHRFTNAMVTNASLIQTPPEVQVVMNMDGWGTPQRKTNTYLSVVQQDPVQFAGFKIFYKNDLSAPDKRIMTPTELMKLKPRPSYIQYQ